LGNPSYSSPPSGEPHPPPVPPMTGRAVPGGRVSHVLSQRSFRLSVLDVDFLKLPPSFPFSSIVLIPAFKPLPCRFSQPAVYGLGPTALANWYYCLVACCFLHFSLRRLRSRTPSPPILCLNFLPTWNALSAALVRFTDHCFPLCAKVHEHPSPSQMSRSLLFYEHLRFLCSPVFSFVLFTPRHFTFFRSLTDRRRASLFVSLALSSCSVDPFLLLIFESMSSITHRFNLPRARTSAPLTSDPACVILPRFLCQHFPPYSVGPTIHSD